MTLLITTFAAVITACIWYCTDFDNSKMLGTLCLMYTGAALMWLVDAVVEYNILRLVPNTLHLPLTICLTML
ncbi:MAG: hypothetical protein LUH47_09535 [Clostridiales bacterium]|nr:hypothetical protein [Clostridiales bacterium]